MERGESSKRHTIRGPNTDIQEATNILRRNEYLPMASVTRMMRNILPGHARIADDAKETVQECVSEFISFITTEANDKCHGECRKTINAEDIVSAMEALGFDNYLQPLSIFLNKYRARAPHSSSNENS